MQLEVWLGNERSARRQPLLHGQRGRRKNLFPPHSVPKPPHTQYRFDRLEIDFPKRYNLFVKGWLLGFYQAAPWVPLLLPSPI